nr:hypothetical protein [Nitrosomonas nitrosa]
MNLKQRVTRLELARIDPTIEFYYMMAWRFADAQNKPHPEKQNSITVTMRQLAELLPL